MQEQSQTKSAYTPLTTDLTQAFKLECLDSPLQIVPDFCNHNLEQFSQNLRKYDITNQFEIVLNIFKGSNNDVIRTNICQSIINFEFVSNNPDGRFSEILRSCNPAFLTTHDTLIKRNSVVQQLSTKLDATLDSDNRRNEFKLVSSMQIIQNQLENNKVDMVFLDSYREFVNQLLKATTLDQFTTDLIYRYHNQYLMKGLLDVQKVVNLDAVQDIQNLLDRFDTMNNGDNLNLIGLRYRVSPSIKLPTDYAEEHTPLE